MNDLIKLLLWVCIGWSLNDLYHEMVQDDDLDNL